MANQPFSERIGLTCPKNLQLDSIDAELKNQLWNVLTYHRESIGRHPQRQEFDQLLRWQIWTQFFKSPYDEMPDERYQSEIGKFWALIKGWYFDQAKWFQMYEFLEFIANMRFTDETATDLEVSLNNALEAENSAYRFLGGKFHHH